MTTTVHPPASAGERGPPEIDYKPCLLAALVCDIRGFTDLSSHVHSYAHNVFAHRARIQELLADFGRLMADTQHRSLAIIQDELKAINPQPTFAVKGTGDGLLIAVEVGPYDEKVLEEIQSGSRSKPLYDIANALATGLFKLVDEAESISGLERGFGSSTKWFVKKWGRDIGLSGSCTKAGSLAFRVAGAITFGMGFLRPVSEEAPRNSGAASLGDAYGHTVNLAFRLCNVAGRADPQANRSPLILLDRRVGAVLRMRRRRRGEPGPKIIPYRVERAMRGIEENWCYAVSFRKKAGSK